MLEMQGDFDRIIAAWIDWGIRKLSIPSETDKHAGTKAWIIKTMVQEIEAIGYPLGVRQ